MKEIYGSAIGKVIYWKDVELVNVQFLSLWGQGIHWDRSTVSVTWMWSVLCKDVLNTKDLQHNLGYLWETDWLHKVFNSAVHWLASKDKYWN